MVITDSYGLYRQACQDFILGSRGGLGKNDVLESYYVEIIKSMFYELMIKKSSSLLSYLCAVNNVYIDTENFNINIQRSGFKSTYDIIPILQGINVAFTGDLSECGRLYVIHYKGCMFAGNEFAQGYDYFSAIGEELKKLDNNIGQLMSGFTKSNNIEQRRKVSGQEEPKSKPSDTILRIHDPKLTDRLNKYAEERSINDRAMSEQIQQLQVTLQDGLKQIMEIRDGIDYNITREAINQFVSLFVLVDETLQYHPNDAKKDSYHNLIESCEDLLENIKQSLAMLGVTIINDIGKPFNPELHRVVRGVQPMRRATVSRVTKIGFLYKNKVIEKAEVEISEDKA